MAVQLTDILDALQSGDLLVSTHYMIHRLGLPDRPSLHEIRAGLLKDAPRVVRDDLGIPDPRGAVCDVEFEADGDMTCVLRINYSKVPMMVVTAFRL